MVKKFYSFSNSVLILTQLINSAVNVNLLTNVVNVIILTDYLFILNSGV